MSITIETEPHQGMRVEWRTQSEHSEGERSLNGFMIPDYGKGGFKVVSVIHTPNGKLVTIEQNNVVIRRKFGRSVGDPVQFGWNWFRPVIL